MTMRPVAVYLGRQEEGVYDSFPEPSCETYIGEESRRVRDLLPTLSETAAAVARVHLKAAETAMMHRDDAAMFYALENLWLTR